MSFAHSYARADHADAHGNRDYDEPDLPYPFANPQLDPAGGSGDTHMDADADAPTIVYRDPDGNRIVYSHGYLHFDVDSYRDLDIPADVDAATVPYLAAEPDASTVGAGIDPKGP